MSKCVTLSYHFILSVLWQNYLSKNLQSSTWMLMSFVQLVTLYSWIFCMLSYFFYIFVAAIYFVLVYKIILQKNGKPPTLVLLDFASCVFVILIVWLVWCIWTQTQVPCLQKTERQATIDSGLSVNKNKSFLHCYIVFIILLCKGSMPRMSYTVNKFLCATMFVCILFGFGKNFI